MIYRGSSISGNFGSTGNVMDLDDSSRAIITVSINQLDTPNTTSIKLYFQTAKWSKYQQS